MRPPDIVVGFIFHPGRGVYPKGVGRAISHIFESGGLTDWPFGLHIFDRLLLTVALGIPVMPIVNRDYFIRAYVYVKHIAQYRGDSDNRIRVSKPHRAKE